MGCDIHLIVEQKIEDRWVCVRTIQGGNTEQMGRDRADSYAFPIARARNYGRFAALAGVRGDGPDPRGLPEDASETARLAKEVVLGDHSYSWLPLADAARVFIETERGPLDDWARKFPASYYFGIDEPERGDYRLVFGFDS